MKWFVRKTDPNSNINRIVYIKLMLGTLKIRKAVESLQQERKISFYDSYKSIHQRRGKKIREIIISTFVTSTLTHSHIQLSKQPPVQKLTRYDGEERENLIMFSIGEKSEGMKRKFIIIRVYCSAD